MLLVQAGSELFAIGAHCSHYHGPLAIGKKEGDRKKVLAGLRTVRTVIIAAAAARADRSRIEAVLARTKKLLRQGCAT